MDANATLILETGTEPLVIPDGAVTVTTIEPKPPSKLRLLIDRTKRDKKRRLMNIARAPEFRKREANRHLIDVENPTDDQGNDLTPHLERYFHHTKGRRCVRKIVGKPILTVRVAQPAPLTDAQQSWVDGFYGSAA